MCRRGPIGDFGLPPLPWSVPFACAAIAAAENAKRERCSPNILLKSKRILPKSIARMTVRDMDGKKDHGDRDSLGRDTRHRLTVHQ